MANPEIRRRVRKLRLSGASVESITRKTSLSPFAVREILSGRDVPGVGAKHLDGDDEEQAGLTSNEPGDPAEGVDV